MEREPIKNATDAFDRVRDAIISEINDCLDAGMIAGATAWSKGLERHEAQFGPPPHHKENTP